MEIRALRREPMQVVVTAHLIGEYLIGSSPGRARSGTVATRCGWSASSAVAGGGPTTRRVPTPRRSAATAKRALNACHGDTAGYTAYLDRFHSRLGEALGRLLAELRHRRTRGPTRRRRFCPDPCHFMTRQSMAHRRDLDARVRLALLYVDSPMVALRHHAPVGHFFGVPSTQEISDAWLRTWEKLVGALAGRHQSAARPDLPEPGRRGEALPGLSALVSAVAGLPVGPGRLLRDIGDDVGRALDGAESSRCGSREVA